MTASDPPDDDSPIEPTAAAHWADSLAAWAIPPHIIEAAPESPWQHDPRSFEVDDTLDRSTVAAVLARALLPNTGGSVLDVGCGGGRAAMSLVPPADRVIGVDQDAAMLAAFTGAAAAVGVRSATVQGHWPDVAADCPVADVVVCHHVAYNVADIVPFLRALTDHARLGVVLVLPTQHPQSAWNHAWQHFWGIGRPESPTDRDLGAVLREIGIDAERVEAPRPPLARFTGDPTVQVPAMRRRLCLAADRDEELAAYLAEHEPQRGTIDAVYRWPGEG